MERIGFVGLGIMGARMAANLRRAGYELTVHNRTRSRADEWAREHGGTVAATPREVGERSDVVITMVVDGGQVEQALLGAHGVARGAEPGTLCVDMSTIAPVDARRIGEALHARGMRFVDAPVTGSSPRAEAGTLTIMAGGAQEDVARAQPLFDVMGQLTVHVGPAGHGQTVKLINNAVAATNCAVLAQALLVGRATGVDVEALVRIMAAGSGASTMLDLKAGPMQAHDWSTLFKLEHMLKDVRLCLEESDRAGVPFPAAAATRELLVAGMRRGLGDADFAAVLEVLEGLAGIRL
jgi:3-hydroxyisobutyrate dehydrogenase-like beta-hydroxyacid dehydrogenase